MLDMDFSRWLAAGSLDRRATSLRHGRVAYRLADGSGHIGLDAEQWAVVRAHFDTESTAVGRVTRRLTIGLIPAVFLYGMTIGQVLPGAGLVILAALLLGPIGIYLWQSHRMQRIVRAIETDLATLPRITAPPRRTARTPLWLEITVVLLAGPHLLVQLYGSFHPDAFRNTPWSGAHLDMTGIAAFLALAALAFFRWRSRDRGAPEPPPRARVGRGADVVARAQREAP